MESRQCYFGEFFVDGFASGRSRISDKRRYAPDDDRQILGQRGWIFRRPRPGRVGRRGIGNEHISWDFESSLGLDDKPDLLMSEFGWQYGKDWGLSFQYFRTDRHSNKTLEDTIEWEDLIFNVGVDISATSKIAVTRLFFSRRFWDGSRHSVRLGAGIHLLEAAVTIGGEATLNDMSTEYRTGAASASFPVPDIGVWYRYSPSDRWLLNARLDWFSLDVGDFVGSVWNFSAGANFRITEHFGIGLSYQLFELDGRIRETYWRGSFRVRLTGPNLHLTAHW